MKTTAYHSRFHLCVALLATAAASLLPRAEAANALWSGAGADQNWSTGANWSGGTGVGGTPATTDTAIFGNGAFPASTNAVGSVNSIVNLNTTVAGLSFTNVSPNTDTIQIDPTYTLTVLGTFNVGSPTLTTVATFAGTGNMTVTNVGGNFNVGGGGASSETATLTLADGANTITVGTLSVGESGSNNGRSCVMNLGNGPTLVNANTIHLGTGKASGTIQYASTSVNGSITIRSTNGTGRATILLGNGTSGSGASNGKLLLTSHPADILGGTLTMGQLGNTSGNQQGTLSFDHGTVDVTSILMGVIPSSGSLSTGTATGSTINVGGDSANTATLIVNSPSGPGGGSFIISDNANASHSSSGTLNINQNGTALVYCPITKAQASLNTATISITTGSLNLGAATNTVGTAAVPIDNVSLSDSVLTLSVGSSANIVATSLNTGGNGNTINIASVPVVTSYPQQFPLIQYSGSINGSGYNFTLGTLPAGSPNYQGYLSNNTTSVDLVLTNGPVPSGVDVWNGLTSSNWDLTTLNWTNSGAATTYHNGDAVQFDDTATGATNVNLTATLIPGAVVVSNSVLPYVFSGPGSLNGVASLKKYGNSSLLIVNSNANTFSGGIVINGGTVQFGTNSSSGSFPPANFVTNNGSLVLDFSNNTTISSPMYGAGSLTQIGNGILSLSGSNSFAGQTTVGGNGSLMVDSYLAGGGLLTNSLPSTIGGTGTNSGPMNVGGNLNPGDANGIGTFNTADGLTLYPGAIATFDLTNSDSTMGNGINDLLQVTGDLTLNNNVITINVRGVPQPGTTYAVATYSGALNGNFNPTISGTHYAASVDTTSVTNQVNVVINGSSGANLKWSSTVSPAWNNGGSQNWLNLGNATPDYFYAGDTVLMDDSVAGVVTNIIIPSATPVYPLSITNISSANSYTFSGGSIGGAASIVKDGSSTLTISNANFFTGEVDVYNGILRTGNGAALGTTDNGTVIHVGATLDVFGQNLGSETVTVSGAGVGGNGGIINSGAAQTQALKNVTLAGDTTFGGIGRWDIRGGSATLQTQGSPVNITKVGTNQISLVACTCNDGNLENVNIQQGIFAIQTSSTQYGDPNGFITIYTNAELDVYALAAGLSKNIVLLDGSLIYSENGSTTLSGNIELTNNAANTAPGTGILTNNTGTTLVVNSVIGGPGNLLKTGAGTTQLGSANTNSGATTISAGTLALLGSGSLANSTPISVAAGATFDVSAIGNWSLSPGQTLSGAGTVNGGITSVTGSIIAPGSPSSTGVLTVAGNVALGGTTTLKLSKATTATNDVLLVSSSGTLALGGTLNVTLLSGSVAANDTFTLFSAPGGISGFFATTNLPALSAGLAWNTSNLGNGVLSVVGTTVPTPQFAGVRLSGTSLILSATNGLAGQQYVLLGSTNLAKPLNQWTPLLTNTFDSNGNLSLTNSINPALPQEFFRISY